MRNLWSNFSLSLFSWWHVRPRFFFCFVFAFILFGLCWASWISTFMFFWSNSAITKKILFSTNLSFPSLYSTNVVKFRQFKIIPKVTKVYSFFSIFFLLYSSVHIIYLALSSSLLFSSTISVLQLSPYNDILNFCYCFTVLNLPCVPFFIISVFLRICVFPVVSWVLTIISFIIFTIAALNFYVRIATWVISK